jgi:hypothetical protein
MTESDEIEGYEADERRVRLLTAAAILVLSALSIAISTLIFGHGASVMPHVATSMTAADTSHL